MGQQQWWTADEFKDRDGHPRARRTDPRTSHEAAASAVSLASEHRRLILRVLIAAGEPLAAEQVAYRCGLSSVQVCRRFAELERAGDIVRTEETHMNSSGRHAFRYRAAAL